MHAGVMRNALAFCAGPAALSGMVPSFQPPAPAFRPALPPVAEAMARARRAMAAAEPAEALRAFESALVTQPRLALAHLGRAVCLSQMERPQEAADALDATLDAARGQEEVLYHLARMCAAQGNASMAIPLLADAVRAMPALAEKAATEPLFRDHPAYLAAVGRL